MSKTAATGELLTQTVAMPGDTNPSGDIFGGWLLSQMDIAGGIIGTKLAQGRVVTVGIDKMEFHLPVMVGDVVSCYGREIKRGRSSVAIHIEAWVTRRLDSSPLKVTEGVFTYVRIDRDRKPVPLP